MIDHLAALVKRITELCQAGLEACHCVEEFYLFDEFTPSVTERSWHSNVRGWLIPAIILLRVTSSSFLYVIHDKFVLI
jgi:hypothetical protein